MSAQASAAYRLAHLYYAEAYRSPTVAAREYWLEAANKQQDIASRA